MWTLHPSCIHILRWSLKRSVKWTWTGFAFSTNESAWIVLVTGSQSRVWSGPLIWVCVEVLLDAQREDTDTSLRDKHWLICTRYLGESHAATRSAHALLHSHWPHEIHVSMHVGGWQGRWPSNKLINGNKALVRFIQQPMVIGGKFSIPPCTVP